MNKYLYFIILLLLVKPGFSQNRLHSLTITITDSLTKSGIPNATVKINPGGFLKRDSTGKIKINNNEASAIKTIKISIIGYKTLFYNASAGHPLPDTFSMARLITSLQEVKVVYRSPVKVKLGNLKTSYNVHWHPWVRMEFAKYIHNDEKISGKIESIELVVNNTMSGIEKPFLLALYAKDDTSLYPGTSLLKDSLIIYNSQKKRNLSVDISKYNIRLPQNGFFVVFETLSPSYYDKELIRAWDGAYVQKVPGLDVDKPNKDSPLIDYYPKVGQDEKYYLDRINKDIWSYHPAQDLAIGATIVVD